MSHSQHENIKFTLLTKHVCQKFTLWVRMLNLTAEALNIPDAKAALDK